jgi:hypothetical protein
MRKRLLVTIAFVVVAGGIVWIWLGINKMNQWYAERAATQGITNALVAYAESNQGRLPDNWDDLVKAGIASRLPAHSRGLVINHPYAAEAGGQEVEDTDRYRILFGLRASEVAIKDEDVFDLSGHAIRIISPSGSTALREGDLQWMTLTIADAMKKAVAGENQPSSNATPRP